MAKKFNAFEALRNEGYELSTDKWGREVLTKTFAGYSSPLVVEAIFNPSRTTLTACYYDGGRKPFKEKVHLNDKRAYNAIQMTISYNTPRR